MHSSIAIMSSSYSTVFGYHCIYFAWLLVCLFFWIVSNLYLLYLSVCHGVYLSVCIQKTSKRLNRSGPNCVWDLTWLQGRFMDAQNYKNYVRKFLIFVKFWKFVKNIFNSRSFFVVVLYCTKRIMHTDSAIIKNWNRRYAWSALKARYS